MRELHTANQPNSMEEGMTLGQDLPPAPAYHGDNMDAHQVSETLARTRCRRCGLWENEWNMSPRSYCAACEGGSG